MFGSPRPEVPERLKRHMLRRRRSEVLKDLPAKRYKTIRVNGLDKGLQREMDEATRESLRAAVERLGYEGEQAEQKLAGSLDELLRETAAAGGLDLPDFRSFSALRAKLAQARIPALIEMVESYEESETPLVVFSAHRAPVLALAERDGWEVVTGDTSPERRQQLVQAFQAGELRGLALTIQAGGVGLTLTRAAHAVFVDLDWTPAMNLQAEDRICRIGQQAEGLLIVHMVSDHVLDRHIQRLILKKMRLIQQAIEKEISFTKPREFAQPELFEETAEQLAARIRTAEEQVEREQATSRVHAILGREQAKSQIPEPDRTAERKALIRGAISWLSERCDGAMTRDGQGFNRPDAAIGNWLARTGMPEDDDTTYRVAERIVSRYYRQLGAEFQAIWTPDIKEPS